MAIIDGQSGGSPLRLESTLVSQEVDTSPRWLITIGGAFEMLGYVIGYSAGLLFRVIGWCLAGAWRPSITTRPRSRHIPAPIRREVFDRDGGQCVDCGSAKEIEYDHILPYSRGGTSKSASNIALRCLPCNRAKGARP